MKIRTKVFFLGLVLPLLALGGLALWTFAAMREQADVSLSATTELGETAARESEEALLQQAKGSLLADVRMRSNFVDAAFLGVADITTLTAEHARLVLNAPPRQTNVPYRTHETPPPAGEMSSQIRIAPDVNEQVARSDIDRTAPLDDMFARILALHPAVRAAYIGTRGGVQRRMPWVAGHREGFDPRRRSWYELAEKTGKTGWTELYIDASEGMLMVTCFSPVYAGDGALAGVIGVDTSLSSINRMLISNVGRDSFGILLDAAGIVMAEPETHNGSRSWKEAYKSADWSTSSEPMLRDIAAELKKGAHGVRRGVYREREVLMAYAPVESCGWSLCMVTPVDVVVQPAVETRGRIEASMREAGVRLDGMIRRTRSGFLVCLAVVVVVLLGLALRVAGKIVRPVQELSAGAHRIGGGDFDFRLSIRSGDEIEQLADSFNQMGGELKNYMATLAATTAEKERIQSELNIAYEIQAGMLPNIFPAFPDRKELDIYACMKPAREVGGDFYDFFFIDEWRFCFLVGDVSGKGVPAALFMAISKAMLQAQVRACADLPQAFGQFNRALAGNNPELLFVTAFAVLVDVRTGEASYVDAGHNPPFLRRAGENAWSPFADESVKAPVAGVDEDVVFAGGTIRLNRGDRILLYTDGVTEAFNPALEEFGETRLINTMARVSGTTVRLAAEALREELHRFADGAEQSDDITLVCFEFLG